MEQLLPATLDMAVRRLCTALTVDDRSGGHAATIERCINAIGKLQFEKCSLATRYEELRNVVDEIASLAKEPR